MTVSRAFAREVQHGRGRLQAHRAISRGVLPGRRCSNSCKWGSVRNGSSAGKAEPAGVSHEQLLSFALTSWSEEMARYDVDPATSRLVAAISGSASGLNWQTSLAKLHDNAMGNGHPVVGAAILGVLDENGQWQQALGLLEAWRSIESFDGPESRFSHCWQMMIRMSARAHAWSVALALLEDSGSAGVSSKNMREVARSCASASAWQWALALADPEGPQAIDHLEELQEGPSDRPLYLVHKTRRIWQLLEAMNAQMQQPDLVTLNALMGACSHGRQWQLSIRLLEAAMTSQSAPDVVSFTAVADAAGQAKQWTTTVALLEQMCNTTIQPDAAFWSVLISSSSSWRQALLIWEEMLSSGAECNVIVYTSLVNALGKSRRWELCLHWLTHAEESSLQVDAVMLGAALGACVRAKRWTHALALLDQISDAGKASESSVAHGRAMMACARARQTKAVSLLAHTVCERSRGYLDEQGAAIAFRACGLAMQWEAASMIVAQMHGGSRHRILAIAAASAAIASTWLEAVTMLQHMNLQKLPPTASVYSAVVSGLARAGQWQQGLLLHYKMREQQASMTAVASDSLVRAMTRASSWQVACKIMQPSDEDVPSFIALTDTHGGGGGGRGGLRASQANASAALLTWLAQEALVPALALLRDRGSALQAEADVAWARLLEDRWHNIVALSLLSHFAAAPLNCCWPPSPLIACHDLASRAHLSHSIPIACPLPQGAYAKEFRLLHHVLQNAEAGYPKSVYQAIEDFGKIAVSARGQKAWLKVAAGGKGDLLAAVASSLPSCEGILEIGTYCGYSALRMADASSSARITTLEVDPFHMLVARHIIAFAGLAGRVEVRCLHSKELSDDDWVRSRGPYGMLFMDSRSSGYEDELMSLQREGMLKMGAVAVADNVLKPGSPLFLWSVMHSRQCETRVVSLEEFAMRSEDWMSVTLMHDPDHLSEPEAITAEVAAEAMLTRTSPTRALQHPEELVELQRACERMRLKATQMEYGVDFAEWAAFARHMKSRLAEFGITPVSAEVALGWLKERIQGLQAKFPGPPCSTHDQM